MLHYPHIEPVLLQVGFLKIHWYGLMYLIGFLGGWGLGHYRISHHHPSANMLTYTQLSDVVFYAALGVIIGGRLGYVLVYAWPEFYAHPMMLFKVWQGGMSFHGGFLGVLVAMWCYTRRQGIPFLVMMDFVAPFVPIGLGAGRLGNFINGELWGRATDVPWAMVFPYGGAVARHPSQLYEFLTEGVLLFLFLWHYSNKRRPVGAISAWFLIGYGLARIFCEFFREPDVQLGFIVQHFTMGQILSLPMVILGGWMLLFYSGRHHR